MTALFNGRFLTRQATGVDRFAIELMAALARRPDSRPLRVAVPTSAPLHDRAVAAPHALQQVGSHDGQMWEQFELPRAAGDDVLVNLCNTAPFRRRRQFVVIHDLGAVANAVNYSLTFRSWYRLMHGSLMRRARLVTTVSRFSADELTAYYGRQGHPLEIIGEGGEHILRKPADTAVLRRLDLQGRRYVLAVGTRSPNKNFRAVLQAMQLLRDPRLLLVAAGGGNARIYAAEHGLQPDGVRLTGYVSDGELRALYENAACFAFPSYYEGFGLPPLEAMCCGCPVVVSDRASLPEVCGDAALYCKPENPATLADALRRILSSATLTQELRSAGHQRAAQFGWDKAARQFQQLLDAHFN